MNQEKHDPYHDKASDNDIFPPCHSFSKSLISKIYVKFLTFATNVDFVHYPPWKRTQMNRCSFTMLTFIYATVTEMVNIFCTDYRAFQAITCWLH